MKNLINRGYVSQILCGNRSNILASYNKQGKYLRKVLFINKLEIFLKEYLKSDLENDTEMLELEKKITLQIFNRGKHN